MGQSSAKEVTYTSGEHIYVLELSQGKYYVGKTKDIKRRFEEHLNGEGSQWTKKYKPISVINTFPVTSMFDEDNKVKELMSLHGIDNVRGGTYSQAYLMKEVKDLLEKELIHAEDKCFNCGKKGHFVGNCSVKVPTQVKSSTLECVRCHHFSHIIATCNSYNTKEGEWLCSAVTKSGLKCRHKVNGKGVLCISHRT